MRPLLLPALRRIWRDATTLQLGVDPDRAVVLSEVDAPTLTLLELLDGSRTLDEVVGCGRDLGLAAESVRSLVTGLNAYGAVVDAVAGRPSSGPVTGLLAPDLAALSFTAGAAAGQRLRARTRRSVLVRCRGRIGPVVAALLAASGVGRVAVSAAGTVRAEDAAVGGLTPADAGVAYALAAADAVRRAAPRTDTRMPASGSRPDFVVLAAGPVPSPGDRLRWTARRVSHLPVLLRDATAVVGPLVVPGSTACLDCVELHRRDRDQAWPAVAAQLATDPAPEASHVAVATAAAALAAMQVLAYLDGDDPETRGVSLELNRLGDRVRHRPWEPHPRCGCLDARPTRAA